MQIVMKYVYLSFLYIIFLPVANGQIWTQIDESAIRRIGDQQIFTEKSTLANVDDEEIKNILWNAPNQKDISVLASDVILPIMQLDGSIRNFKIVEYDIVKNKNPRSFPNIKTFIGVDTQNRGVSARIDYTIHGFRAVINNQGKRTYIDHFQTNDRNTKVIYTKDALLNEHPWFCETESSSESKNEKINHTYRAGDCQFREYEIAIATTGEYSNYHGATSSADSALVHSAVVTTLNRVNEVYEIDATVRFVLIPNNHSIYYYDGSTDPYSNGNASAMLSQNQTNIDNVIGNSNYDIGHVFGTGGGGVASLGALCNPSSKARGVTLRANPIGDPFDIDYVAHEVGHQMGANHTQNNSCNRNNSTAMEPGSASTIMGYAGICSPNVQSNSDAFFHAISVEEMADEIFDESIDHPTCEEIIPWANSAPTITPLADKTLPISTPFVLETTAMDSEMDSMTYTFDQMDPEVAPMPPASTNTGGPAFRAIFGTPEPRRYFPSIDNVVDNTSDTWEVLPSVARTMDFRLTVRDFHMGQGGCTSEEDVTLTFDNASGPFVVTSQNTGGSFLEQDIITVTWDVANTDTPPVSCSNVDIFLSYDGGYTYPVTLISNTPNDGSQDVQLPIGISTTCRIMVKGSDNYFYDINDTDFEIQIGAPSFALTAIPATSSICNTENSYTFELAAASIAGFTGDIALATVQSPSGSSINYSQNPINPGDTITVTVSNVNLPEGDYTTEVSGTSSSETKFIDHIVSIVTLAGTPTLLTPANNAMDISTTPFLSWQPVAGAFEYEYELGTESQSGNVLSGSTSDTEFQIVNSLSVGTTYFWRVRAINGCGNSAWSEEFSFETKICLTATSSDVPMEISSVGTPTITSILPIKDKGIITDVNVVNLVGTHTWVSDLNFTLIAPDETSSEFWTDPCNDQDDFNINFDDDATSGNWPCPPTDGGTYIPEQSLAVFNGNNIKGTWIMEVFDDFNQDGGSLDGWALEFCMTDFCDLTVTSSVGNGPASILEAIECAAAKDTIWLESSIPNQTINLGSLTLLLDKDLTLYSEVPITISGNTEDFILETDANISVDIININFVNTFGNGIENNGTLRFYSSNVSVPENNIQLSNKGNFAVSGNCNLLKE